MVETDFLNLFIYFFIHFFYSFYCSVLEPDAHSTRILDENEEMDVDVSFDVSGGMDNDEPIEERYAYKCLWYNCINWFMNKLFHRFLHVIHIYDLFI